LARAELGSETSGRPEWQRSLRHDAGVGGCTSFQSRTAASGASTSVSGGTTIVAPEWVKIVRTGSLLSGYQSKDGVTWTSVGAVTMAMSATVTIGLAVTSHDSTRLSKAVFESVGVK